MADIEKVIKGLQAHADGCGYRSHHCDAMGCPYRYGDESCDIEEMCRDALELLKGKETVVPLTIDDAVSELLDRHYARLKEQEVVKPTWSRGKPFCGACGLRIHGGNFCSECGKPILWGGR